MKILIISPYFAPYDGVGAARMTSLSASLIAAGCEVVVVSLDADSYPSDRRSREVPEGVQLITHRFNAHDRQGSRQLQLIVEKTLQSTSFDGCVSSVGPFQTMFFAWKLFSKYKVPYIIDYRDPWLFSSHALNRSRVVRSKAFIRDLLYLPIEALCVSHATSIISVTDRMTSSLNRRYWWIRNKTKTIYNGFEKVEVSSKNIIAGYPQEERQLRAIALGKFSYYDENAARKVIKAMSALFSSGNRIEFMHIGEEELLTSKIVTEEGYPETQFASTGHVPYATAIEMLNESSALILTYRSKYGLGTKVFDYIRANKPIVFVGRKRSELASFLKQFQNAFICESVAEIQDALLSVIKGNVTDLGCGSTDEFERSIQNTRFIAEINSSFCERAK